MYNIWIQVATVIMKEGSWQFPCFPLTKSKSIKESCHVSNCNVISWNRPFQYFPYLEQYNQLTQTSSHCLEAMTKRVWNQHLCQYSQQHYTNYIMIHIFNNNGMINSCPYKLAIWSGISPSSSPFGFYVGILFNCLFYLVQISIFRELLPY
jgi:hypothetical protein